jgi:seryl-tRNA synthetase
MLDLRTIRENPEPVRRALARRGEEAAEALDRALELDAQRRALTARVEELRAEQNRASRAMAKASKEERLALMETARAAAAQLKELEPKLDVLERELADVSARLPNPPDDSVPDGVSDEDNREVRTWGEPPEFDFPVRDHIELGEALGMIDIDRAVRASGSRFYYLMRDAVAIQFALMRYALDFGIARGLTPVITPVLVREEAMFNTGFLPTDESQFYRTDDPDGALYLVGTSEVTLAALHAHEILDADELPLRYMGYSSCFRREAGTYGKDTRGIFRVHQFDKLEMFSFVLPEESADEHERLLATEEEWVQSLELPYRVVNVCIGDLGGSAAKKYDIEAWFPGQGKYREITSTSNTTDFQARRMDCRIRLDDGTGTRHVHTLNGTLCAMSRTLIALIENGQQRDGSILLPEALRPYFAQYPAGD